MSSRSRFLLIGIIAVIVLPVLTAIIFPGSPHPPVASLQKAKAALDSAATAGALRYAQESYRGAEELMRVGWIEMARQSGRLAFLRRYKTADSVLNLAAERAHHAAAEAQQRFDYLDSLTKRECGELEEEVLLWEEALRGSLIRLKAQRYLSSAQMSLEIGRELALEGEFEEARRATAAGTESLAGLAEMLARYADDGAQKVDLWRRWVQQTLEESRRKSNYAVIVDKSAHKTYLVRAGMLAQTYPCELGYNSSHNKLFAGDGATPEGKYRVSVAKPRGSKYYKALLLDYPNHRDRMRFQENMRKGIISPHTGIGSSIEIHGEGGKGRDWTEGCVALTNSDMDNLMKYVRVGTAVTIVRRSDRWP